MWWQIHVSSRFFVFTTFEMFLVSPTRVWSQIPVSSHFFVFTTFKMFLVSPGFHSHRDLFVTSEFVLFQVSLLLLSHE